MTISEDFEKNEINLKLSKPQALVLFEWLSRNWERTHWEDEDAFNDVAEKQVLMSLEGLLQKILVEPFDKEYREILSRSYREIVPEPQEWE